MKVFISQAMNGRKESEIRNERNTVLKGLKQDYPDEDIEEIQSFIPDKFNADRQKNVGLRYLGKSIEMVADADVVVFVGAFESATGCSIEHAAANAYGLKVIYR